MRLFLKSVAIAGIMLGSAPAHAAWYKAQSKHFIIYADERPQVLTAFATKLERFDAAVRFARAMADPAVGDGNRLTVFVLSNDAAVRKLLGANSSNIYGYYLGSASGPVAFVPRDTDADGDEDLHADTVFFHEYSHHLMFQALILSRSRRLDLVFLSWAIAINLGTGSDLLPGSLWGQQIGLTFVQNAAHPSPSQ